MTVNAWGADNPIQYNNGGTSTGTAATGDILYASAANTLSKLAAGTDDHVLTVATDLPNWEAETGGSGGWTFLATASASASANINFDSTYITGTYEMYCVIWQNYRPASDSDLWLRFSPDNGSTIRTTGYDDTVFDKSSTTATSSTDAIHLTRTDVEADATAGEGVFYVYITNAASSSLKTTGTSIGGFVDNAANNEVSRGYGRYDTGETHNYLRFQASTGNIAEGTATLYGINSP
jgi:hypothetical protein